MNIKTQEGTPTVVIRKRLKLPHSPQDTKEKIFRREFECLDFLRCFRHPNIVELLSSYSYKGHDNLIFPLLPLDLASFLQRSERFGDFKENVTFFIALRGLASALRAVHNSTFNGLDGQSSLTVIGYHHDIRPKNVLVTPSTFILADFGLARLKSIDEDSKSYWRSGIGDYVAPECMDENFNHLKVGRSIDIWSFGCLVAEVTTYMEGGPSRVKEFREKRALYDPDDKWTEHRFFHGKTLKPSVTNWLAAISVKPIEHGIRWLVGAAELMLQIKYEERPKASAISRIFDYLSIKALFRTAMETLTQSTTGPTYSNGKISPHDDLTVWFEIERFKAWGLTLGMHTDQINNRLIDDASIAVSIGSILHRLRTSLQNSPTLQGCDESAWDVTYNERTMQPVSKTLHFRTPWSENLRGLVQELWEAVPLVYQKRMAQVWRQSSLDIEETASLGEIEDGANLSANLPSNPYSEFGAYAALKRLQQALRKEIKTASLEQRALILRISQIEKIASLSHSHFRELGWYRPRKTLFNLQSPAAPKIHRVLIEWMLYTRTWGGQSDEEKVLKVVALVELLHSPKPEGFRVLDCVGVIPPTAGADRKGFGFVYSFPSGYDSTSTQEPSTLLELLQNRKFTLLLEDKYRIAESLASSIFQLHSAGWLHKNVEASNLLFFSGCPSDSSKPLSDPYLGGFHFSRPDGNLWFSDTNLSEINLTQTNYRHPEYKPETNRFQKSYDYYSVGIVLFEVAFWRTISSFKAQHPVEEDFRKVLIETYVPMLGPKMGSLYRDAVGACLSGQFMSQEEEPHINDELAGFYWNVVAKLSRCNVG